MTDEIYLLLGSNLGNRLKTLKKAQNLIDAQLGSVMQTSAIYETAPWGKTNQPAFLNQVIRIKSELEPKRLLAVIQKIESELGRVRQEKWGERKIDLDILFYQDLVYDSMDLIIPHPELQNRRFTLIPLVEIAPDFVHPVLHKTNKELLVRCQDLLEVKKLEKSH